METGNGLLKTAALFLAAALSSAAAGATGGGGIVYTAPDETSFWRTATNNVITLPVHFPRGASSAELEVRAWRYRRVYGGLQEGDFNLELPAPTDPSREDVYELKLVFDDGTVRRARLGVIFGTGAKSSGSTRCVFDGESADWTAFTRRAVLPVFHGAASLSVNGEDIDLGFDGGRGWFSLVAERSSSELELGMSVPDGDFSALLRGYVPGMLLLFR